MVLEKENRERRRQEGIGGSKREVLTAKKKGCGEIVTVVIGRERENIYGGVIVIGKREIK